MEATVEQNGMKLFLQFGYANRDVTISVYDTDNGDEFSGPVSLIRINREYTQVNLNGEDLDYHDKLTTTVTSKEV